MEKISCIFCGAKNSDVAITEKGFTGLRCARCELIYISPRPGASEVTRLYTDEHAVLYADAQFQFDGFNRMEAARALATIGAYRKGGSILELGAGGGCFLSEARRLGYEPHGIELNPIEARWINEKLHIPCEARELSERSFEGKRFDIIYHRDVLSHLSDPISTFREMHRALKDDGLVVFETGNIADVRPEYMKHFSQFSYPDHLFFFGERSIGLLLERTGFSCLHVQKQGILLPLLLQKVFWGAKDSLKDPKAANEMRLREDGNSEAPGLSLKRRLRLLYRYAKHYLGRLGGALPTEGRPLKLVVIAQRGTEKEASLEATAGTKEERYAN